MTGNLTQPQSRALLSNFQPQTQALLGNFWDGGLRGSSATLSNIPTIRILCYAKFHIIPPPTGEDIKSNSLGKPVTPPFSRGQNIDKSMTSEI